MEALFLKILNMSITATYVLVAVLVLRLLLRRAPKWISYSLWSLVLFRLLCPVSFSSEFSIFGRIGITGSTGSGGIEHIPASIGMLAAPQVDIGTTSVNTAINSALPVATPAVSVNPMQIFIYIGTWVWLTGFAVMLIYSITSYLRLKFRMREATLLSGNVFEIDIIHSPFVCGLIKPKIYLPIGLSESERRFVLCHEQTHIARKDYLIKPLAFLVLSVHWLNPFMWLAFLLMSRDLEMSCDEKVISNLDLEGKAGYSSALIQLAMQRPILAGSPLAFGESGTKGRVKNVLNYKKPAFWTLLVAVAVVILATVCLLTNPTETPKLPDVSAILSMEMEQFNDRTSVGTTIVTDQNEIKFVVAALTGARKTLKQSVNDNPTQNNYLVVRLSLEGEMRTLYLYTEGNGYYIEEPYIGVYKYIGDQDSIKVVYERYTRKLAVKGLKDNSIEIFVWKDKNQIKYSVFQGIKVSRIESEIYKGNMVFSDILDVNRVLATYQADGLQVSIRQMNTIDFTKDEMQTIADSLKISAENYIISIGVYVPAESLDNQLSPVIAKIEPTSPELSLGQSIGVGMPELDYASDDIVIFHGYFGLFVYDLNTLQIIRSLDLKPLNCHQIQGSNACDVSVSVDGNTVQLHPMESKNMYIYTVSSHTLREVPYQRMEKRFSNNFVPTGDVIDSSRLGVYSYNAVRFDTGEYGYLRTSKWTLDTLSYVREDMQYKLFDISKD